MKTRKKKRQVIERVGARAVARRRARTDGQPAWKRAHVAFGGHDVFPTDVALLVGCDLPYACRVLQKMEALGLARKTGGLRTPYRVFRRAQPVA